MNENQEHGHGADIPLKASEQEKGVKEELLEEIDLEVWAKEGKEPKKAKRYRLKIDDKYYVVDQHEMTGAQILELAGKTPPSAFILTMKVRGQGVRTIALDEVVDFSSHKVERFATVPRQVQEGVPG